MGLRSSLKSPFSRLMSAFGYAAVEDNGKRKSPVLSQRSEDAELTPSKRNLLISASRDSFRNFAVAAWACRKHLDYVSAFGLQVKSPNAALADAIEQKFRTWGAPGNCEITGRHSLRRFIRLAELRRTLDGDIGILRLRNGQLQAIEGDRIRTPQGGIPGKNGGVVSPAYRHGVITDLYGRPLEYAVCRRDGGGDFSPGSGGFTFESLVPARDLFLHAYWDRFDQTRGISPLAAGLNTLVDCYEGFDLALAKMKVSQLMGLVFTSKTDDLSAEHALISGTDEETDEESTGPKYRWDPGKGPVKLELEPGEDAKFLTVDSPGIATQEFLDAMIAVALKSLDIPFSFFNESFTNYSGSRQAWIQYDQSASEKREDLRALLDWIARWRLLLWTLDGELPGADLAQVQLQWIPRGVPWIDPLKEVQADQAAVDGGFTSRQRVCKTHGEDYFEIIDELAEEQVYAKNKGVALGKLNPVPVIEQVDPAGKPTGKPQGVAA